MKKLLSKLFVVVSWTSYGIIYKLYYPILSNSQALKQFENNNDSFINYQAHQLLWQRSWKFLLLISFLVLANAYKKDIKQLMKKS